MLLVLRVFSLLKEWLFYMCVCVHVYTLQKMFITWLKNNGIEWKKNFESIHSVNMCENTCLPLTLSNIQCDQFSLWYFSLAWARSSYCWQENFITFTCATNKANDNGPCPLGIRVHRPDAKFTFSSSLEPRRQCLLVSLLGSEPDPPSQVCCSQVYVFQSKPNTEFKK